MKYCFDTITSGTYWRYALFSKRGLESFFAVLGIAYLLVQILDFFKIYTQDKYGEYGFLVFAAIALVVSLILRTPARRISFPLPGRDAKIEVVIGDLFEFAGASMISTNTVFECDVAGGKIAVDSLQGQFTAKYFTGNQTTLIERVRDGLSSQVGTAPYPMGTTVPIVEHGKTFYLTAMSTLNENGNALSTPEDLREALDGLWSHVHESGELQELALPIVGTGRGRVKPTRKRIIGLIAGSFFTASENRAITDKLVIFIRPEDAVKHEVNLYDVKDHLIQNIGS